MPAAWVPMAQRGMLAVCNGGYCVPDEFIRTANNYLAPTCRPFAGMGEGRCLSRCVPMVASQAGDARAGHLRGGPALRPVLRPAHGDEHLRLQPDLRPGPAGAAVPLPGVLRGRARCVPSTAVPAAQRESLAAMGCAAGFRAPNENLDPSYRPVPCRATPNPLPIIGQLPAYNGFCVSTCVDRSFFERLGTAQGTCAAGYFCGPCRTPLGGRTGVPGCT